MSINKLHSHGFLTLEILAAITLLLVLGIAVYIPVQSFLNRQYALQLKIAAQELAADIRATQQRALFGNAKANRIIISEDKEGYVIEAKNQSIRFKDLGCEGVYFDKAAALYISYSNIGAPNKAGDYVLKHNMVVDKSYTLTIQPSSGRIDVHEQ